MPLLWRLSAPGGRAPRADTRRRRGHDVGRHPVRAQGRKGRTGPAGAAPVCCGMADGQGRGHRLGRGQGLPRSGSGVTRSWSKAKTTAAARSRSCNLVNRWLMCVLTVPSPTNSSAAISVLVLPCPMSASTSRSRPVRASRSAVPSGPRRRGRPVDGQHPAGDRRVEPGTAVGDHAHRPVQVLGGHALEDEARTRRPAARRPAPRRRRTWSGPARAGCPRGGAARGSPARRRPAGIRTSISTTSGARDSTAAITSPAVSALTDDVEAELGAQDAAQAGPHQLLIVDQQHPDHVASSRRRRWRRAGAWPAPASPGRPARPGSCRPAIRPARAC